MIVYGLCVLLLSLVFSPRAQARGGEAAMKGNYMENEIGVSLGDLCPVCAGKRKVVTLSDCREWDERQEAWVPLTASICEKCGQTTIHTFHPEMFTAVPTMDKNENEKLAMDKNEDEKLAS